MDQSLLYVVLSLGLVLFVTLQEHHGSAVSLESASAPEPMLVIPAVHGGLGTSLISKRLRLTPTSRMMRPSNLPVLHMSANGLQGGEIRNGELLSNAQRMKQDMSYDNEFYDWPKLVYHVSENFREQLTELYRERIPKGGAVLDLCSSHVSHLPKEVEYEKVITHGMNEMELRQNPQSTGYFVQNFNENPRLAELEDSSFDAVLMCVSIQYMQNPEILFEEIYRVLKPGGQAIISFSNRMFPHKAISAWTKGTDYSHVQLVKSYFRNIEGFEDPDVVQKVELSTGSSSTSSFDLLGMFTGVFGGGGAGGGDPFYAIIGRKSDI